MNEVSREICGMKEVESLSITQVLKFILCVMSVALCTTVFFCLISVFQIHVLNLDFRICKLNSIKEDPKH